MSRAPSNTPSHAPSHVPSHAPSQAPSRTPSRAPSQSPASLAETSAPPRSPAYKAPYMTTIAEDAGSIDPSPCPSTIVPASRGLHLKTHAPIADDAAAPSRAPSRAPSHAPAASSSSRAGGTRVPSLAPSMPPNSTIARSQAPHAAATSRYWPGSVANSSSRGGIPALLETPSAAPSASAAPTHRSAQSIVPTAALYDDDDMAIPTTIAPAGGTTFPKSAMAKNKGKSVSYAVDPDEVGAAPTMIPTASGVPLPSRWTSEVDIKAATRQVNYAKLGEEERRLQDKWAKKKADEFAPCPANYAWMRHETRYRCVGSAHFMSDLMLAQGEPGLYYTCVPKSKRKQYLPNWNEDRSPENIGGQLSHWDGISAIKSGFIQRGVE
ncbi:hypothetical protein PG994_014988 [Apiospora phragmitis]|uniref:Uncharacterized protein n=1 Tax=Apiospora phragmitis TaxID=2905665 RepID=A0ABR1SV62_9PEZI